MQREASGDCSRVVLRYVCEHRAASIAKISLDFGITITDTLKKTEEGTLIHKKIPSAEAPDESLIRKLFSDVDFSNDLELIALTGGHHQKIGAIAVVQGL